MASQGDVRPRGGNRQHSEHITFQRTNSNSLAAALRQARSREEQETLLDPNEEENEIADGEEILSICVRDPRIEAPAHANGAQVDRSAHAGCEVYRTIHRYVYTPIMPRGELCT